ncbi:hypothetical protein ACWEK5_47845 [Rhodococcus koreensis]
MQVQVPVREAVLSVPCRTLLMFNDDKVADDLVREMTEVMTSLWACMYGQRRARRRAAAAVAAATGRP